MASEADVIVLDLEDEVSLIEKEQTRKYILGVLAEELAKPILVRINCLNTAWALQDLLAVVPLKPLGIILPKTESASDVKKVCWVIDQLIGNDGEMGIYPLIETARGVEEAVNIAKASKRIKRLIFGGLYYSSDIGLSYSNDPSIYAYARARLVAASAIAEIEGPVDTVYPAFKDEKGLRRDTLEGKKMGCKGKMVIHPAQIAIVKELYTPTVEEFEEARQIVEVYLQSLAEGNGAAQWQGKILEEPVLKRAQKVLRLI
jgi:citrate lyase subunit beta/citryl-CoA lyase